MRIAAILFLLFTHSLCHAQVEEVEISSNWRFRQTGTTAWMKAQVPGTIHTDLLANHKIPDPFFERNELLVQWVDTLDWEYETIFSYQPSSGVRQAHLLFEGLDTYATVYLNGSPILSANNMFRSWKVDCFQSLKKGNNILSIKFSSAVNKGKEEARK